MLILKYFYAYLGRIKKILCIQYLDSLPFPPHPVILGFAPEYVHFSDSKHCKL